MTMPRRVDTFGWASCHMSSASFMIIFWLLMPLLTKTVLVNSSVDQVPLLALVKMPLEMELVVLIERGENI